MEKCMIQGSPEWLEMRKSFVCASDAPVIMGVSPYKTERQLWEEKLGLAKDAPSNRGMEYGRRMEEPARQAYEQYTGNLVAPTVVFHPDYDFMMASLDGLTFDKTLAVEIKNVNDGDHETAKKGRIPEKYFPQLQHQLACLGTNMLHYFSFRQGDFALVEVPRDENYIKELYSCEKKFWSDVQNLREPGLSEMDYVTLDDEAVWMQMATSWKEVNEQLRALTAKEKEYRQALIDIAQERNARGSGIKLTKSVRKGAIDYSKIKELEGIDLDQYRKEPVVSWRIS